MRRLLLVGIVAVAVAGCTHTSLVGTTTQAATSSTPSVSLLSPQPKDCPSERRFPSIAHHQNVIGTARQLVPGEPSVLVLCVPGRRIVVKRLGGFVDELNALERVTPNTDYSCPLNAGPTYGLFFDYSDGDVLLVTKDMGGCGFFCNGSRVTFTDQAVEQRINEFVQHG